MSTTTTSSLLSSSSASSDTDDDAGTAVGSDGEHDHVVEEEDGGSSTSGSGSEDGCEYCTNGRYNLCESMRFCSSAKTFPHLDGTLQTSMNHPAHLLHL